MVAVPDWSQTWARTIEAVQLLTDARANFTANAATSFINQEAAILGDGIFMDSDVDGSYKAGLNAIRAAYSSSIASARAMVDACLLELSRVMGQPQTDPVAVFPFLYQYMAIGQGGSKSPARVNSRNFSRGSATAGGPSFAGGSNVGTGTINRLNVDQYGLPLESGAAELMQFQCLADANSGTNPGQEQFNANGQPFRDALQRYQTGYGSGIQLPVGALIGISGDTTANLILNPSFSQASGSGSGFTLNNWTISSGAANLSLDTTHYYRACALEGTTPASLKATGNFVITQTLASRAGALQAAFAYFAQLAVNFSQFSGTGSVQVQIGALTWTLNSGSAGWLVSVPTFDKTLYFSNFNAAGLAVTITGTLSGGTAILIDDFLWSPYTNIGGSLYAAVGGATNWAYNDTFTITDIEGTPAKVQREFSESYGWSLPSVVQAAGGTAPGATASAGAGMTPGYHGFAYTYYNGTTKVESQLSATTFLNLDGTNGTAALTGITTGPAGTTKRYVYATRITTSTADPVWYFAGEVADNTTTTKSIAVADAALLLAPGLVQDPVN